MNVDHYFTIGTDHQAQGRPCEDYALSGELPGGAVFGVVADGCSGANANTDIGARALAWAFRNLATDHATRHSGLPFNDHFHGELLVEFMKARYSQEVKDYLATLVGFIATPETAAVYVQGDGVMALCYADGSMRLVEFSWANNMPYYLGYRIQPHLAQEYESQMAIEGGPQPFTQTTTYLPGPAAPLPEQLSDILTSEFFKLDQVKNGHVLRFNPREEGIVAMAVMTDGVAQIGAVPSLQLLQVARAFTAFKNNQGAFVKRRLLKALKDFKREDALPRDDVGMACVWFGTAPNTVAPPAPAAEANGAEQAQV